ncbi:MAG: TetR/AcrR family transcriptional regulator [Thermoleophilia bacterium]
MATDRADSPRRSTRDRPAKPPLSERAVVDAAMGILRAEGIDAVTMRRVAAALDTGASSLYVYVRGRDELLRLLFDEVVGEVPSGGPVDPARWRERLRELCVASLEALERYPGIARVALAEVPTGPNAMAGAETMMALLRAGGVEPGRAALALDTLFLLITAKAVENVIERQRVESGTGTGYDRERLLAAFAGLAPDRHPTLVEHARLIVEGDGRDRFLFAIDTFVDGLLVRGAAAETAGTS